MEPHQAGQEQGQLEAQAAFVLGWEDR
jgi:hypothetical protein